jgi:hypothetical protein
MSQRCQKRTHAQRTIALKMFCHLVAVMRERVRSPIKIVRKACRPDCTALPRLRSLLVDNHHGDSKCAINLQEMFDFKPIVSAVGRCWFSRGIEFRSLPGDHGVPPRRNAA